MILLLFSFHKYVHLLPFPATLSGFSVATFVITSFWKSSLQRDYHCNICELLGERIDEKIHRPALSKQPALYIPGVIIYHVCIGTEVISTASCTGASRQAAHGYQGRPHHQSSPFHRQTGPCVMTKKNQTNLSLVQYALANADASAAFSFTLLTLRPPLSFFPVQACAFLWLYDNLGRERGHAWKITW